MGALIVWLACTTSCRLSRMQSTPAVAPAVTYYVAVDGNDAWSGRLPSPNAGRTDGPFATLVAARDAIRARVKTGGLPRGGITVELREGEYPSAEPLELAAIDSGTADSPIEYRARPGEHVRISGGRVLTRFEPVTNPAIIRRLDPAARNHVVRVDLRSENIANLGAVGGGGVELFFDDRPMTVARWPDEGFATIQSVTMQPGSVELGYGGTRPERWVDEPDVWLHGYWFWDWTEDRERVVNIDPARHTLTLAAPLHEFGYRKGQRYYAFNVLSELDRPGEWYVDRRTSTLYFWPPASPVGGRAVVSMADGLVRLHEVSHVSIRGITFEAARGTAITIDGGHDDAIVDCTIRNVGGWGITAVGATGITVMHDQVYGEGEGGILLSGGDRATLTRADDVAAFNDIHDYSRWKRTGQAAIAISGVGIRVEHNLVHDAPHQGITFSGNDHLIAMNEILRVCTETNDCGAVYAGRDWSMRGTVIRNNLFHDISGTAPRGGAGVYLDDMFSGTKIVENIFENVSIGVLLGGGRDNLVEQNIFADCDPAIHLDDRGLAPDRSALVDLLRKSLQTVPFDRSPWRERYPELASLLDDDPGAPKGNTLVHNVWSGGRWDDLAVHAGQLPTMHANVQAR